jgi:RimJ/RimL family protein N-acetyltransferase
MMLSIGQSVTVAFEKVRSRVARNGILRTLTSALWTAVSPILRRRNRLIWEMKLGPRPASAWERDEELMILGPDNVDQELTAGLRSLLAEASATQEIEGVRGGDRLFVVASKTNFLACSYIFFDTTKETRRHARIYGEPRNTPIIGMSFTSPAARGRGLYRRILNDMFVFLAEMRCERAICEIHPDNTPSNRASEAAGMRVCRELRDWSVLNRIFVQRVTEGGKSRWRVLWA